MKEPGQVALKRYMSEDELVTLLSAGYRDEVRAFTRKIEADTSAVLDFESFYDWLNETEVIHWEGTDAQLERMYRIDKEATDLNDFLAQTRNVYGTYLKASNHGPDMTFEIGWDCSYGRVVWNRWTETVDDPVIAFSDVAYLFDIKEYRCEAAPKPTPPPKLYRFHPERFKAYRQYADPVAKFYRQKVDPNSGLLTLEQMNATLMPLMDEVNKRGMQYPRKWKDQLPPETSLMKAEQNLSSAYGRFVQAGRQIMSFPPELIALLAKTDVDDIPLDAIHLPYASQYIYLGPQPGLELEPGWIVDGAYVEQRGERGDIRFTVTAVPNDQSLSDLWYVIAEPEYTQDFVEQYRSMDLGTAVDMVLSDRLAGLQRSQGFSIQEAAIKIGLPGNVGVKDVSAENNKIRREETLNRHTVYRQALTLIVNALCYVSSYPDDIDAVWPDETPKSLLAKVEGGQGKAITKAKSKLASMGYVPVHICGKHLAQKTKEIHVPDQSQGERAVHWRRGHWRRQPHGPGRKLRKLIWLMPSLIGVKERDEPETGHLYLVEYTDDGAS